MMDLEGIILSEISQTEKDKYHTVWFSLNLTNKENEQTNVTKQNKLIKTEQIGSYQRGGSCGKNERGEGD